MNIVCLCGIKFHQFNSLKNFLPFISADKITRTTKNFMILSSRKQLHMEIRKVGGELLGFQMNGGQLRKYL